MVKSFKTTYEVATYRAAKLSDDFYMLKAELEQRRDTAMSKARSDLTRDPSLINGKLVSVLLTTSNELHVFLPANYACTENYLGRTLIF